MYKRQGLVGIHVPLPQGTILKEASSNQTIYNGPNQSLIEIVVSDLIDQLKQAEAGAVSGKSFQNQSNLTAGSQVIGICLLYTSLRWFSFHHFSKLGCLLSHLVLKTEWYFEGVWYR